MRLRKLDKFTPSLVTKEFFPNDVSRPKRINYGKCFLWAYAAHKIFQDAELWDMPSHAFVRYRGKFYDSETLKGVKDWRDLPACSGCSCGPCIKAREVQALTHGAKNIKMPTYLKDWRKSFQRYNISLYEIDRQIDKLLAKGNR